MNVFVVTGRAGSLSWPAKVFHHEFSAQLWMQVAHTAAVACAKDYVTISWLDDYIKLPDAAKREVDDAILAPFKAIDPACNLPPTQWHKITYSVERVALHD